MSYYDDQINLRRAGNDLAMQEALESLLVGVTGNEKYRSVREVNRAESEIDKVLAYCGAQSEGRKVVNTLGRSAKNLTEDPEKNLESIIDKRLDSTGVKYRAVHLSEDFYKDAVGCFLAEGVDGKPIALIPSNRGGYYYSDPQTGSRRMVDSKSVGEVFTNQAYCFYRPLPNDTLSIREILAYMIHSLEKRDYVIVLLATLVATLLGAMLPALNNFIFGPVVNASDFGLLIPVGIMLFSVTIAQIFIQANKSIVVAQVSTKLNTNIQAAMMMRILSLPVSFFRQYSSGELTSRFASTTVVVTQLEQIIFGAALTSLFSLVYVAQLMIYSPLMVIPALITIAVTFLVNFFIARAMMQRSRVLLKYANERSSLEFDTISAMQKIKLAGAEKRMFSIWAKQYAKEASLCYGHPGIAVAAAPLTVLASAFGTVLIYYFAVMGGVESAAEFMAFSTAYGMVSSAFAVLNSSLSQIMGIRPNLEQIEPILQTLPESNENKYRVENIRGAVSLQNVQFSYSGQAPYLFDGLNLEIHSGQHVAIVGETGCGKSTIMRLILGFETPVRGTVLIDDQNITKLDTESLRRHMGVVLQDGALVPGSLFSNIAITSPNLTMDEAWEVAEMAGIAEEIRRMPMGMMTMVGEDGRGISGGQRQRIMIARALASKPKILLFDEATSALDNITQRQVAESLDSLKCTRIVIAHRLSTIQKCDKIFVLEKGAIVEEGTYEELMALDGYFVDLVARQRV